MARYLIDLLLDYPSMNEYLEQLVRVSTNAYSRSQRMFGERVSPGPANQRSFPGLPCCWGQMLIKQHPLIHLSDYALSLSLSACFLRTRFVMSFAKDKGQLQTSRPYSLYSKVSNTNGKLLSPNHLRSLPAAPHSDLSARQYKGVIPGYDVRTSAWQHDFRGYFRSYSATASLRHIILQ